MICETPDTRPDHEPGGQRVRSVACGADIMPRAIRGCGIAIPA